MKGQKYTSFMCQCNAVQKVLWSKDFLCMKKLPYGSVFLLLLSLMKIPIFQGYWRWFLSIRLIQLFLLVILLLTSLKLSIFIRCYAMQKVLCAKVLVCKKKLPYGSFFMHRKSFDHSTFCTALHWHMKDVYLCLFMYVFVKILLADLWITY